MLRATLPVAAAVLVLATQAATARGQWRGPRPPPREVEVDGRRFRPPPPEGRPRPEVGFLVDVTTSFGDLGGPGEYVLVSPLLRGYWRFAERWAASVDYGFSGTTGGAGFASGNPLLAAHHLLDLGDGTLRIGLGVGLPLAGGEVDRDAIRLSNRAIGARVGWDAYLWLPESLSFVVPFRIETYTAVLFAAELTVGGLASFAGGETFGAGIFQIAGELGGSFGDVDVGLRVGASGLFVRDGGFLNTLFEPFVRAHLGAAVLMLRGSLPLVDTGAEVAGGAWGLHVGLGAELGGEPSAASRPSDDDDAEDDGGGWGVDGRGLVFDSQEPIGETPDR